VKPTCGVSLAVVGKATMQDQLGQDAGTAYFTDELLWCAINGTNINDAFGVSQTPEGGTRLITPEVVPNCLPYSNIRVQPAKQAQPPVNPGPRLPAPEPALSPAPGANLPAGAGPVAWKAKLSAENIQQLGKHSRRSVHLPGVFTNEFMGMGDICSNPSVGFANPGALKVTVELTAHKQFRPSATG
jgi:hypothetical protein